MTEWLHFHFSFSCIGEGNGNPLQCSCLENPRDGGAWWAAVYGVAQSRTGQKRLSSSSSREDKKGSISNSLGVGVDWQVVEPPTKTKTKKTQKPQTFENKLEFTIQSYDISFQRDFISEGKVEIVQVACAAPQRTSCLLIHPVHSGPKFWQIFFLILTDFF